MDSRNIDVTARKGLARKSWPVGRIILLARVALSASACGLQHQIENLHLPHRERREEKEEGREGESGILRHKNVHFGEEDKMYEGAKKEGEERGATSDRAVEIVVLKTQLVFSAFQMEFI